MAVNHTSTSAIQDGVKMPAPSAADLSANDRETGNTRAVLGSFVVPGMIVWLASVAFYLGAFKLG